jgi:hypothetical protein
MNSKSSLPPISCVKILNTNPDFHSSRNNKHWCVIPLVEATNVCHNRLHIATRYTPFFHALLVEFTLLNFRKNNFFLSFYVSVGKLHLDFRSIFQTVETRHRSTVSPFQTIFIPYQVSEVKMISMIWIPRKKLKWHHS